MIAAASAGVRFSCAFSGLDGELSGFLLRLGNVREKNTRFYEERSKKVLIKERLTCYVTQY